MNTETKKTQSNTNGHGSEPTHPATPTVDGILSGISHEFHNFLADIEDLIKATTSLTGEDLVRAKEKLSERITAAKKSTEEMGDAVYHRARKSATVTNNYVHDQPWQAIGVGAAVGFLFGFALARRA